MKFLKFRSGLADMIISGEKTSTWRLYDDKNLEAGDELQFIYWDSGKQFGVGEILSITEKTLGELVPEDYEGHEKYADEEEMYAEFRKYYGDKVGPDSPLKIIRFSFRGL